MGLSSLVLSFLGFLTPAFQSMKLYIMAHMIIQLSLLPLVIISVAI